MQVHVLMLVLVLDQMTTIHLLHLHHLRHHNTTGGAIHQMLSEFDTAILLIKRLPPPKPTYMMSKKMCKIIFLGGHICLLLKFCENILFLKKFNNIYIYLFIAVFGGTEKA